MPLTLPRRSPHEPVGHTYYGGFADDYISEALVEAHVLRLVGLEVADLTGGVQAPAVLAHDQRADALALHVRVDRQRAQVDVRFVEVVPGPGVHPTHDACGDPRAED